ncbi:Shedu anti-phage system protein SduA domain-containing protein [Priestia aryabhattai]|uniref:Shedu anti-phage system protein SduA domain-containing protein n=1 Tax=Priestia aryabhattai TaxID=412384 RepID=UPI003D2D7C0F
MTKPLNKMKIDSEYKNFLSKVREPEHKEREIHEFLEKNPSLLPYVSNCYSGIVVSEYQLSGTFDREPDFLYCFETSNGMVIYMVEIEAPHKKMFLKNSNNFTADFKQAYNQLEQWYAWTKNEGNSKVLLHTIRNLCNTPANPDKIDKIEFILIYGSRQELNFGSRRDMRDTKNVGPFEVMSFDRLEHTTGDMIVVTPQKDHFKVIEITSDYEVNEALHGHFNSYNMIEVIEKNKDINDKDKKLMIKKVEEDWCD